MMKNIFEKSMEFLGFMFSCVSVFLIYKWVFEPSLELFMYAIIGIILTFGILLKFSSEQGQTYRDI